MRPTQQTRCRLHRTEALSGNCDRNIGRIHVAGGPGNALERRETTDVIWVRMGQENGTNVGSDRQLGCAS